MGTPAAYGPDGRSLTNSDLDLNQVRAVGVAPQGCGALSDTGSRAQGGEEQPERDRPTAARTRQSGASAGLAIASIANILPGHQRPISREGGSIRDWIENPATREAQQGI